MSNFWGYRIDTRKRGFFFKELQEGRLRQGWGSRDEDSLLTPETNSKGAQRNQVIRRKVKEGDILLIPGLPSANDICIAVATADFDSGYRFEKHPNQEDYRHVFPARLIKHFSPHHEAVPAAIRKSVKARCRFWSMNKYGKGIQALLDTEQDLQTAASLKQRFAATLQDSFETAFDSQGFQDVLYQQMVQNFQAAEWEYALIEGLKRKYPAPCKVERAGGITEKQHGCDITIRLPGLLDQEYLIAIQVKDYANVVSQKALEQLSKAVWWEQDEPNTRLIEKILIVTRASAEDNAELLLKADGFRVIFADELKALLTELGQRSLGITQPILVSNTVEGD